MAPVHGSHNKPPLQPEASIDAGIPSAEVTVASALGMIISWESWDVVYPDATSLPVIRYSEADLRKCCSSPSVVI